MANKISDTRYREAAHRLHHEEGVCEVDENAKISRGDDPGAYVQAWVWVYNTDTKRKLTPDELTRWQTPGTKKVTRSAKGQERHKLALITDIIVNHYGEEDEPFSKKELKQILDSVVEVMDAK